VRDALKLEDGRGHRPREETRVRVRLPVRRFRCRSRQAATGFKYAPAQRPKKGGGRSERGPSKA
jgi:hypothetical protein